MTYQRYGRSANDANRAYAGRYQRRAGKVPIIHCHGFGGTAINIMDSEYTDDFKAMVETSHPLVAGDLGGTTTWGNDLSIARVDEAISWLANEFGTRTDRVALIGDSMGALLALNWAWRNPGRTRAVVLRSPVVALEAFRARNAVFTGAIDAAYGGSVDQAEYDTHDPMRNLDLIRPFGDRVALWYATSDEYTPLSEVESFAAQIGAQLFEVVGNHASTINVPPDGPAYWLFNEMEKRRSTTWDWSQDWTPLREIPITNALSTSQKTSDVLEGRGRKGFWKAVGTVNGNDRRVYQLPDFQAVDSEILNYIDGAQGPLAQQGNFHRIFVDDNNAATSHVVWQNIVFGVPWIINYGVWIWDVDNSAGDTGFDTNQTGGYTVPALEIGTGGRILSASRTGGVVTAICDFNKKPKAGEAILVRDMDTGAFNAAWVLTEVGDYWVKWNMAGADLASAGDGAFANFNQVFPFWLMSRCSGASPSRVDLKAWQGDRNDEPEWGDPYYGTTAAWESGHYSGYGGAGFLIAHPVLNVPLVQGRVEAYEL